MKKKHEQCLENYSFEEEKNTSGDSLSNRAMIGYFGPFLSEMLANQTEKINQEEMIKN
ncbi:MAG: hypothetical protein ACFFCS_25775 [Candidatus Hodarchaeota archaeon]